MRDRSVEPAVALLPSAAHRRSLFRALGVGALAATPIATAAREKKPARGRCKHSRFESCFLSCTRDHTYELTADRAAGCASACFDCDGELGPVCFASVDNQELVCCADGQPCYCVCGDLAIGHCPL